MTLRWTTGQALHAEQMGKQHEQMHTLLMLMANLCITVSFHIIFNQAVLSGRDQSFNTSLHDIDQFEQ